MSYQYPENDFDRVPEMLSLTGSFWSSVYDGQDLITSIAAGVAELAKQWASDYASLVNAVSVADTDVYRTDRWYKLELKESTRDSGKRSKPKYDSTYTYALSSSISYGINLNTEYHAYPLPDDLADITVLMDSMTKPTRVWVKGIDFFFDGNEIVFIDDPLESGLEETNTWANGEITDTSVSLWAYNALFERSYLSEQWGYIFQVASTSSESYRRMLSALFGAVVEGTTVKHMQDFFSGMLDVAIPQQQEVVERLTTDGNHKFAVTDKAAYKYSDNANWIVSEGDTVNAGQELTDALTVYEFTTGTVPGADEINNLVLGKGFLAAGFFADIVFPNKDVDLVVEEDVNGKTKLTWELGGWPADVERFFDLLHSRGVAEGTTLANLLDIRPDPGDEPTALNLPATINPFQFLVENVLRNNAIVVKLRPSAKGPDAVGFEHLRLLRTLVPPYTAVLLLIEHDLPDVSVNLDGLAASGEPTYEDTISTFDSATLTDTVNPSTMVSDELVITSVVGRCI